jgi:hypothetical protein
MHVPFSYAGNQATTVLDKDELDTRALRLAVLWAGYYRRQLGEGEQLTPASRIAATARDALGRAATVRRAHRAAEKKIAEVASHLDAMVTDIDEILAELQLELARANCSGGTLGRLCAG